MADESDSAEERILQGLDEVESDLSDENTNDACVNAMAGVEGSSGDNVDPFHSSIPTELPDTLANQTGPELGISALDQQNDAFQSNTGSSASRHQQRQPTVALEIQPTVSINQQAPITTVHEDIDCGSGDELGINLMATKPHGRGRGGGKGGKGRGVGNGGHDNKGRGKGHGAKADGPSKSHSDTLVPEPGERCRLHSCQNEVQEVLDDDLDETPQEDAEYGSAYRV